MNDKKKIQDNCQYCHEPYKIFKNGKYDCHFSHFDEFIGEIISNDPQCKYIYVHYCPMCGRDMTNNIR